MLSLKNLLHLMRPKQWRKNGFVLVGYLFGPSWIAFSSIFHVFLAILAFCLASSGVYILNDYKDLEKDRNHPLKRFRPLAAGIINPKVALSFMILLWSIAILFGLYLSPYACLIILFYILINIAYSYGLKSVVILDVFCISAGFILRMLMGIIVVGAYPSNWFLLCGMGLTLFLAFSKRYAEITKIQKGSETRDVLQAYTPLFLQNMIVLCAASTFMFYSLYTICPRTTALHGTQNLIFTVPLVVYGFMRYIFIVYACKEGEDPSSVLTKDRHLFATVMLWVVTTAWIIK